jgi:hypothetical protein
MMTFALPKVGQAAGIECPAAVFDSLCAEKTSHRLF